MVAAAVGRRAPASSPLVCPWLVAGWPWAGLAAGVLWRQVAGGSVPLRTAARIAQPGLSRGVARG